MKNEMVLLTPQRRQDRVFWAALTVLLVLRIPLASWCATWFPAASAWIGPVYEIGTYLLVAFLIWWERDQLSKHHIDFWAVAIILLFKPLSLVLYPLLAGRDQPLAFPNLLSLPFFFIALVVLAFVLLKKIDLGRPRWAILGWTCAAGVAGVAISVIYGILMIRWAGFPLPPDPGKLALIAPVYQLGYAAVSEEPVFRGFLWGGLRALKIKEGWILIIQAVFFLLGHIHLLEMAQPVLFFGITFLNGLLFGWVAWRTRSIAPSMAMHGFANGSVIFQYWIYSFLFK